MLVTCKVFEKAKNSWYIVASTSSFFRLCGYDNVIYHQMNFILELSEIKILASKWPLQYWRNLYLPSLINPLISRVSLFSEMLVYIYNQIYQVFLGIWKLIHQILLWGWYFRVLFQFKLVVVWLLKVGDSIAYECNKVHQWIYSLISWQSL